MRKAAGEQDSKIFKERIHKTLSKLMIDTKPQVQKVQKISI